MEGSALLRATIALLSGLLLWAGWFTVAYAFHGAQCAGGIGLSRTAGQLAQIALWLASLGVIIVQARWAVRLDVSPGLCRTARVLQITAITATLFSGLPILLIAPC